MREAFQGFYPLTEEDTRAIWEECIFSFDSNVLLDLYKYTLATRQRLFDILNLLRDRIWLSNQVALEYLRQRLTVIDAEMQSYDEVKTVLNELIGERSLERKPLQNVEAFT